MGKQRFRKDYTKELKKAIPWLAAAVVAFFAVLPQQADSGVQLLQDTAVADVAIEQGAGGREETWENTAAEDPQFIFVDVAGAVVNPGVFQLPLDARVYEAVEAAGGLRQEGDTREVNLAARLADGQKIYIPATEEMKQEKNGAAPVPGSSYIPRPASQDTNPPGSDGKVNINSNSLDELQRLTGVGPSTAERILQYRQDHGDFTKIEDLKQVKGIGEKTFEKLKDSIYVP